MHRAVGQAGQDLGEAFEDGDAARLTAGVAADVGDGAVRAAAHEHLAHARLIELSGLVALRRRRRGLENLSFVRSFVFDAFHVDVSLIGRQCGVISGRTTRRQHDRQRLFVLHILEITEVDIPVPTP